MAARTSSEPAGAELQRRLAEAGRIGRGDASAGVDAQSRAALLAKVEEVVGPFPAREADAVYDAYLSQHGRIAAREDLVDAASEMSFPASDPPSFMAGTSTAGAPPPDGEDTGEKPNTRVSDPSNVKPSRNEADTAAPARAAGRRK